MSPCVGILSSHDEGLAHGEARDALAVTAVGGEVGAIESACHAQGWKTVRVEADADPRRTLEALERAAPDVVFHLAESVRGEARFEAAVAWLLEWARIPYTGSGPVALTLALDKPLARGALTARSVPVPRGFVIEHADAELPSTDLSYSRGQRWIVKPSREDASHGISIESVVGDEPSLRARAAYILERYAQPALVEEFIDGRELNVSILGTGEDALVLPLAEIDFTRFPRGQPPLVTYAAKWIEDSPEYQGTPAIAARALEPALERRIRETAIAAYHALGLSGYGRIDLRLCEKRGPLVLDVNPNPDISPDAGFARAAARGGITYAELISKIVHEAQSRFAALDRSDRADHAASPLAR